MYVNYMCYSYIYGIFLWIWEYSRMFMRVLNDLSFGLIEVMDSRKKYKVVVCVWKVF